MTASTVIAPSELLLLKVLFLGFFFGASWRRFTRPKVHDLSNVKYFTSREDVKLEKLKP